MATTPKKAAAPQPAAAKAPAPVKVNAPAPGIPDKVGEPLNAGDVVIFTGKVTTLNPPGGVTIRVGKESEMFVDVSLPASLTEKQ